MKNTMFTVCLKCKTEFKLPKTEIPVDGMLVRCAKCQHVWRQFSKNTQKNKETDKKENTSSEASSVKTVQKTEAPKENTHEKPEQSKLSQYLKLPSDYWHKLSENKQINKLLKTARKQVAVDGDINDQSKTLPILVCVLLCMILGALVITSNRDSFPVFEPFFKMLKIETTKDLGFAKLEVNKQRVENRLVFTIDAEIINQSNLNRLIPELRVRTLSKGGGKMRDKIITPPKRQLGSEKTMSFNFEISTSGNAESIAIDLANSWEMLYR